MYVMQISKHTAESCPDYNPKYRDIGIAWFEKGPAIAAKFGVKIVNVWNDHPKHELYIVYETPTMEALMGFFMDPVCMATNAFNTSEIKMVMGPQEVLAMMKAGH